ncbi:transposase [Sulfitobacter sp. 1A15142]|uniref:transposase n=2 Tax=unclassified Sulfitobacter TaxID=196795 RepID=UPI00374957A6
MVIPTDLKEMRKKNFLGRMNEEIPMRKTRFTEAQFMGVLRQMEGVVPAAELCREHGMSSATLYKWRAKYGGMDASLISEMKAMAEENRRLKRMYTDVSMQNDLLKEALGKNETASSATRVGRESGGDGRGQHCAGVPGVRRQ